MPGQQGVRAGKAFVELYANDTKLTKGLKLAQRRMQAFGRTITTMGAKLTGVATVLGGVFIPAIKAASDMQEVMSKFNTVFAGNSKAMKEWSDNFAKEIGRSRRQVAEFLAGSQDLFVPLGFEASKGEELSKLLTRLAIDLGSFNNRADADVMRDLQAALTGSGEVMKKYGVIVSEAAVKQELLNQSVDPTTATNQQKVMARLNIILAGTIAAQGDAARTSESFANQMKRLKAEFENTKEVLGTAVLPTMTSYVEKMNKVVPLIADWVKENKETIKTVAETIVKVGAAGIALVGLGQAISAIAGIVGGFHLALGLVVANLGLIATTGAVIAIGAIAKELYNANDAIKEFNSELERNNRLTGQMDKIQAKRLKKTLDEANAIEDEGERKKFLESEVERLQKELAGGLNNIESQKKLVAELSTKFNRISGNKILADEKKALKDLEISANRVRGQIEALQEAMKLPAKEVEAIFKPMAIPKGELKLPNLETTNPLQMAIGKIHNQVKSGALADGAKKITDKVGSVIAATVSQPLPTMQLDGSGTFASGFKRQFANFGKERDENKNAQIAKRLDDNVARLVQLFDDFGELT